MVLSFLSSITINQFNSWSIIEENRKKNSVQQNGIQNWIAWLQQSNKTENGILHFRGIELNCSFFSGGGTTLAELSHKLEHLSGKYFFEESHMTRITYDKKRMHEAPDPYASSTRRNINKATSITSVNATQARPYNISLMIVISCQWWYFRMPQGEIAEARRR